MPCEWQIVFSQASKSADGVCLRLVRQISGKRWYGVNAEMDVVEINLAAARTRLSPAPGVNYGEPPAQNAWDSAVLSLDAAIEGEVGAPEDEVVSTQPEAGVNEILAPTEGASVASTGEDVAEREQRPHVDEVTESGVGVKDILEPSERAAVAIAGGDVVGSACPAGEDAVFSLVFSAGEAGGAAVATGSGDCGGCDITQKTDAVVLSVGSAQQLPTQQDVDLAESQLAGENIVAGWSASLIHLLGGAPDASGNSRFWDSIFAPTEMKDVDTKKDVTMTEKEETGLTAIVPTGGSLPDEDEHGEVVATGDMTPAAAVVSAEDNDHGHPSDTSVIAVDTDSECIDALDDACSIASGEHTLAVVDSGSDIAEPLPQVDDVEDPRLVRI